MSIGARPARRRFSRSATSKSWIATLLLLGASVIAPLFAATGTLQDVEHVVIFMQENRSFDHYYGTLRGIRGFSDTSAVQLTNGNSTLYQPNGKNYILPFHLANQCVEDLNHSWSGGHEAWHNGRWDRWVSAKTTTTMAYYTRAEIPFHYALADAFTVCDAYHCSVLGPSNPNRMYLWTAMIDPRKTGGGPVLDNSEPAKGYGWTTYPERLEQAGVSWKVYQEGDNFDDNALAWFTPFINALPGSALFNKGMARATDFVSAFRRDVTNNTLPRVSWLIAPTAFSEHPVDSPASGASITKQLLDVLASNPAVYASTVFIFTYDENDGFFDHVPPPVPPAGTPDEFANGLPIGLGVRVPMVLVSPWSRGGYVCSQVFDHTSILQFLERVTGVQEPNISAWRRQICGDLTSAFDFTSADANFPALPSVSSVVCSDGVSPRVPTTQVIPTQEPGTRLARALPYQPNAFFVSTCGTNRFSILLTNGGTAGTHFTIYANTNRTDGPWPYDVTVGSATKVSFLPNTNGGVAQAYDLTCYGPDGFLRRFAGDRRADCPALEVNSTLDPTLGAIVLELQNLDSQSHVFRVSANAFSTGGPRQYEVSGGGSLTQWFPTSLADQGRYDFTATVLDVPNFLRRFAGRIQASAPALSAAWENGHLLLSYPESAVGVYTLESTPELVQPNWNVLSAAAQQNQGRELLDLGTPSAPAFFRLRRLPP